jgi:L-alanine-DL-glutamate epimerase-like enolase superfamily enzyme
MTPVHDKAGGGGMLSEVAVDVAIEDWPMAEPLRISGHTLTAFKVVVVTLQVSGLTGRGEACGLFYQGDTPQRLRVQIDAIRPHLASGLSHARLRELMPPGGARNALDCALWDLEARLAGEPVWKLAGLSEPRALLTTVTIGAGLPGDMVRMAVRQHPHARALKLKLLGDGHDAQRVEAVRAARPDVWLSVDGNQGLDVASLRALIPALEAAGVAMIEQPLPVAQDPALDDVTTTIPFAADESVQTLADLPDVASHFDAVNIKLDKCGGLTEALLMVDLARGLGLQTMVGAMGGTSLAMGPALLVGQRCDVVDLDAPLFLAADRSPALVYADGFVHAAAGGWGDAPR